MAAKKKTSKKKVVILGAGYGGITTALSLSRRDRFLRRTNVTLIDRNDYHLVQTELHRVAAGNLSPGRICLPVESLLKGTGIKFKHAEVKAVDPGLRTVVTNKGKVKYDYLVVSTGSETSYFNTPGAEKNALGLKSLEDALEIRDRFEDIIEKCRTKATAPVMIVGAGATGVELAAYMADQAARRNSDVPVVLVDSGKTVMPRGRYSRRVLRKTQKRLEKSGVKVQTGTVLERVRKNDVTLGDGEKRKYSLLVWTAGVKTVEVSEELGEKGPGGRISVKPDLSTDKYPEIFVVGDAAFAKGGRRALPCAAQYAIQQGITAAENIVATSRGKMTKRYVAEQKGEFVSIGRGVAMGWMGLVEIWGYDAQFVKDSILLKYLIGLGPEAVRRYLKL